MIQTSKADHSPSAEYFAEIQLCASMFQTEPEEVADCPRLADFIARLSSNSENTANVR